VTSRLSPDATTARVRSVRDRAYAVALAGGALLMVVYFLLAAGGTAQQWLYDVFGIGSAIAIVAGIALNRPRSALPWLLFALGMTCFAVGDILFNVLNPETIPSAADWVYLAAYPLLAVGLVLLLVEAGGHHRTAAIGEALIFTCAAALVLWCFVVSDILHGDGSALERAVSAAYPLMDIVLLAALAGFFVTAAWRTPSFLLLLAGAVPLIISDVIYYGAPDSYTSGSAVDAGWLLSYTCWAAAALHPSMRELSRPRRRRSQLRISPARIGLLMAALLTPPTVFLVQDLYGDSENVVAIFAASVIITVLVVMRLVAILRALERIRARLVEADRVKDEFVALISHDLRTPLTSVMGYIELALDDDLEPPLDPERQQYLEVVSRSSQRLLRLVDDLLFVARLQAGRLDLTPTVQDLRDLARQAAEEARRRAQAKGVDLVFESEGPVPVDVDKGRIFQLLDNLVSNAIKFTPEGGRIEVAVSANSEAVLEVRDTGVGFTEAEAARVFDRFFRTESAVEGQVQGTGLGLFIAQAITEAHGGRISAQPRDGGGAVFRIVLPRATGMIEA
jgi:signal transduction histidine kinase